MNICKKIILISVTLLLSLNLYSQVSTDPNDDFYDTAERWQIEGIIGFLPQIRPYSLSTIKDIILQVKEKGNEKDVELAQYYERKYLSKWWNVEAEVQDSLKTGTSDKLNNYFSFRPAFLGDADLFGVAGIGYRLGFLVDLANENAKRVLPLYTSVLNDNHGDPATIGPFEAKMDMTTNLTFGKNNIYGFLGLNRIEHGPNLSNSITIDGNGYHMANIGFNMDTRLISYTHFISSMGKSMNNGLSSGTQKYLAFHALRFQPLKQFAISYYESAVVVDRFDPSYIVPIPFMMIQGLYGFADNLLMGINTQIRPVDRLEIDAGVIIDDVNTNGIFKGEWNTLLRLGGQIGISYVPKNPVFDKMSLDYTIVTPYTYGHVDTCYELTSSDKYQHTVDNFATYNQDGLTNRDSHVATPIGPNSDRLVFKMTLRPVKGLKIDAQTSFARHGNIAETFRDEEALAVLKANYDAQTNKGAGNADPFATDGSIWMGQVTSPTSRENNFMAQEHIMYTIQAGFNAEYDLITQKAGIFSFVFGYTFETIINKGVDSNIYSASMSSGLSPTLADVQNAKQKWIDNIHNEFNNYFKVAFKYRY